MSDFESDYCYGTVTTGEYDSQLVVSGKIKDDVKDNKLHFMAAAPPDYRASYSGSALPFTSQLQAFDNTPNRGIVKVSPTGEFTISLMTPNAYYVGLTTVYVPPMLFLEYATPNGDRRNINIRLSDGIPYRSLTWPGPGQNTTPRGNAMFYGTQFSLPVRSQEQILRDSAYPAKNHMEPTFWGLKPPL
jgi:hypothetical protein